MDGGMSARELESLILKRNSAALRWDNEPSNTALAELSEDKIRRFVERAGLPWDNQANALTKLGLLQDGQLLNAARLFFAQQPIQLRCAVFASTTSASRNHLPMFLWYPVAMDTVSPDTNRTNGPKKAISSSLIKPVPTCAPRINKRPNTDSAPIGL